MLQYGIKKLTVSWFDTENDDPVEVERLLLNEISEGVYQFGIINHTNSRLIDKFD